MKVISINTEIVLLKTLKDYWHQGSSQRCLHLGFSNMDKAGIKEDRSYWTRQLIKNTTQFFDDDSSQIYLCADGDIFIFTRYVTHKNLNDFLTQALNGMVQYRERLENIKKNLVNLYEINIDWKKLDAICKQKKQTLDDISEKEKRATLLKKKATYQKKVQSIKVADTLKETLQKRRASRKKPEVMIVEDDLFSQKLVRSAIEKKYNTTTANDGQGAIMLYTKTAPDILFLDIGLPDITGHDVLKRLQEIDPHSYIIMLSGKADKENILKAIQQGAKGFIVKPFTQEKLFQYIDKSPFIQKKLEAHINE